MKVALSLDHLLQRENATSCADIFCELFPDADCYTVAHKAGAVLGNVEIRKIHSTGLSKKVETVDELAKNAYLVPTISQQLFVPCSVDVLFNISRGLSHGFKKCQETKQITYLYDDYFLTRAPKSWRERFFRSYVKSWSKKALSQVDILWVSTQELHDALAPYLKIPVEVVPPFFKITEFPLIPSSLFKHDFYCIEASSVSLDQAQIILETLDKRSTRWRFIGVDDHLAELKKNYPADTFYGDRCAGELAPMLSSARGCIDLTTDVFPESALKSQAVGRPVITMSGGFSDAFLKTPHAHKVSSLKKDLDQALDQLEASLATLEPKKVRAFVMDYHDLKFKGALIRAMDKLGAKHHHCESHPS